MTDITSLIQQAMANGDTATALTLARTLEHQTKISTIPVHQEEYYQPQQQYLPPSQVYQDDYYYEPQEPYIDAQYTPVRNLPTWQDRIPRNWSTWVCLVILPYLAIAEVMTPGHQGPLKIHQTDLDWPITLVGNTFKALGGEKSE